MEYENKELTGLDLSIESMLLATSEMELTDSELINASEETSKLRAIIQQSENEISTLRQQISGDLLASSNNKKRKKVRDLVHTIDDAQEAINELKKQQTTLFLSLSDKYVKAKREEWKFKDLYGKELDRVFPELIGDCVYLDILASWLKTKRQLGQGEQAEKKAIDTLRKKLNELSKQELPSFEVLNDKAAKVAGFIVKTQSLTSEQETQSLSPAFSHALKHKLAASR